MSKIQEEFNKRRNAGNELISKENNVNFNRFLKLDANAYTSGEIPAKYKELMGLACSMVLRCNDCIAYHITQSHKLGCSKNEIIETLNISLVIGGSIVIPHLRYALEIINELEM